MTAAIYCYMNYPFSVSFFWEGKIRKIERTTSTLPKNADEANNLAWSAIRSWFEESSLAIPSYVKNIQFDEGDLYHWDVMDLSSSADFLK